MSAPTIAQQSVPNSEKIGFSKNYPLSIAGLLRVGIIVNLSKIIYWFYKFCV